MIVCNRCGATNEDSQLNCGACGNKLQSAFAPGRASATEGSATGPERLERITPRRFPDFLRLLRLGAEAWACVLVLAAAASWTLATGELWPLGPAIVLTGLLAFVRKV